MASFTDIIPQFNPYVQQLPVEAMVQVGMAKQKAYEENVTKIQAEIDRVAGLDIMRGVDKEYLQSKMNALGNKLTLLAGGDFSNFQLANSVTGMAGQISKDKYVQNAVSSTAWYRKQAAEMEKAKSEGKSSVQNQWDFNEKVNSYLSSTDLETSFKGTYTQYTDVKKKAMEAIKALHPNLMQYDVPFEIKDGKINTGKIADAMQRYKIEGIDERQIQQAIYANLSPDDLNQLSIDARYQFKDVTSDQLVKRATLNYDLQKKDAKKSLDLLIGTKGTTTDPTKLSQINESIEYYEGLLGKDGKPGQLDEQFSDNLKNAVNNPDGVKLSIYKDGFLKEFANAFTWKTKVEELQDSPIRKQMNWVEDMKLKQEQERRQRYEFSVNTEFKRQELLLKQKEVDLKAEENALKNAELYGIDAPWTTLGNPTDNVLKAVEMFTNHSDGVLQNYKAGEKSLLDRGYSQAQINEMVNNKSANIPANALTTVQEMRKQKNYSESLEQFDKNIKTNIRAEVLNNPAYKQKLAEAERFAASINGGRPITMTGKWDPRTKTTQTKQITAKEIIDNYASGKAKVYVDAGQIIYDDGQFKLEMPRYGMGSQPVVRDVFEKVVEYKNKGYFDVRTNAEKEIDKKYKEKLAPLVSKFVPQIKALGADKNGAPTSATIGKVSALITATMAREVAADEVFDSSTASDMLLDKNSKDTRIFIQQEGENYNIIMKSESDPDKLQKIRVSKADVLANFGNKYVNNLTQESIRLDLGRGNTNLTRNPEQATMQKSFGNFPGIRRMNVTADFDQDISNPELFIPGINIMKKNGRYEHFEISGIDKLSRVGYEEGVRNLNALTDDVLLKYVKMLYPNYDYSQLDIK
jgi:hypothetical protein